jgi:hypothetical protein
VVQGVAYRVNMSREAESLRQILAATEREFGRDWLAWRSGQQKQRGQRKQTTHPVAVAWRSVRDLLAELEAGGTLPAEGIASISLLDEVVTDLAVAQEILNFDKAVRPRLKTGEFEKAQFEMHVGALYRRSGQRVEFVLPTGRRRMADVKVVVGEGDVFIECTRKDAYQLERVDDSKIRKELGDDIQALQRDLGSSLEIVALVLGSLGSQGASDMLRAIREVVQSGKRGTWVRPAEGIGFTVRELTPISLPPGAGVGPALPDAIMSPKRMALSEGTLELDDKGQPYLVNEKRVSVYAVDAHRMSSVIDSLRQKLGQIPRGSAGIVYVTVDVEHVLERDLGLYMQMARGAVHAALGTPPGNPQIGAVVLMTTPILVPVRKEKGEVVRVPARQCYLVRNPDGTLPSGFTLPGAAEGDTGADEPAQ